MVIITSYPTRANGIIVLINSQTGFCRRFQYISTILQSVRKENLAHYFPYDVKLGLLAHSRSFLANQKTRNTIVGAENLLRRNICEWGCVAEVLFSTKVTKSYFILFELPQGTTEILEVFPGLQTFFIASTTSAIILGQLCQVESENKILHKFIDMTSDDDLVPKQKTSMAS